MKYHDLAYLPLLAVILALAWVLTACTTQQLQTTGDILDIAGDVAVVDVALHEPDPHNMREHQQWCSDHQDHDHCAHR